MSHFLRLLILALASGFFVSYVPYRVVPFKKWKGGGLIGSLMGVCLILFLPALTLPVLGLVTAVLISCAVSVSHVAEKLMGNHDDPRIIIDEVAGMWIAALGIPHHPMGIVGSFILFRFFDVAKFRWGHSVSRWPGGWGIVADDVAAGIAANIVLRVILALAGVSHGA
ncbi:MAG TPA: phosphatidylglycerophosphatase A [Elusimicrobiota bacterium]|nr:phosphatidylglycerophosphatase A [Elusimicrobiota bacterium]